MPKKPSASNVSSCATISSVKVNYTAQIFHCISGPELARQLSEAGEKVDTDFAGLTVWARTCTGQAICIDSVIEAIAVKANSAG